MRKRRISLSVFLRLKRIILHHLGKPHAVNASTHHRLSHVCFKIRRRLHQILRRFAIQRVARVWIDEQKQQTKNDARHRLYRAPIFAQNVQANVPLRVQVWMVDFLVAQNLRRFVRVRIRDLERKRKRAASPIVFARFNFDPKVHQVALPVRKLDRHPFFEFQFGQIWKKKKNRRQKILGERRRVVVIYLSPTESPLGFSWGFPSRPRVPRTLSRLSRVSQLLPLAFSLDFDQRRRFVIIKGIGKGVRIVRSSRTRERERECNRASCCSFAEKKTNRHYVRVILSLRLLLFGEHKGGKKREMMTMAKTRKNIIITTVV